MPKANRVTQKNWTDILDPIIRKKREKFSAELLDAVGEECLTRKHRDPVKRELMRQLGLPERYIEVQYPSPGNTPEDIENDLV
jgi:hypothetical protein